MADRDDVFVHRRTMDESLVLFVSVTSSGPRLGTTIERMLRKSYKGVYEY